MKKKIYVVIASIILFASNLAFASQNNFQFQVKSYHTQRQSGQTLDLNIRYALKDEVKSSQYPDYRELREIALRYLEPTSSLPMNTYWEIIAKNIGDALMMAYPLSGISVQMLVYDGGEAEPGLHGPIYTVGDVIPWNVSSSRNKV